MSVKANDEINAMQKTYAALKELKTDEQRRVLAWITEKLQIEPIPNIQASTRPHTPSVHTSQVSSGTQLHPKAFMAEKKPNNLKERIACLAYYLTHYRQIATFKTKEIEAINKEAALPKISGPAYVVRDATTKCQYLAQAGGGSKQITTRGEALVEALPVREKADEALKAHPLVRRGKRKAKGPKPKSSKG